MTRKQSSPGPLIPASLVQPHSEESERAVLGAVMLHCEVLPRVCSRLQVEDFYVERHRTIYRAMLDLHAQGTAVDLRTLQARLEQQGVVEEVSFLATLDLDLPDIGRLDAYIDIVVDRSTRRAVIALAGQAMRDGLGSTEVEETLARLQGEVPRLLASASRPRLRGMAAIVPGFMEAIEDRGEEILRGLPTGFDRFDDLAAGLHPGHLIILAGRPGLGKSAFAANVAQNVAIRRGLPVGYWSLEMTEQELTLRMLCSEADVPSAIVRKGYLSQAQWKRLVQAGRKLAQAPIYVDDTPGLTITQAEGRIRRAIEEQNLALVVVDYLQLLEPKAGRRPENRNVEVGQIAKALKDLAKSLRVPVIALSQLSREVTRRAGNRPQLSDLRESGDIENHAEMVAFVHREHAYNSEAPPWGAELIVAKYRHGPTGDIPLIWISETTTFRNPTPAEASAATSYSTEEDPF